MTNDVASGLELTAEAMAKLKPGETIDICFREPVWPLLCWLAMLLIFIALLVLLARGFIWWQRRQQLGLAAAARGRFCGWLANRLGLLGIFTSVFPALHTVQWSLLSHADIASSAAQRTMFLFNIHHALFSLGAGFIVFLAGWLQAFVFELLWRRWELRQHTAKPSGT
ncbi:MAG: hypothetical protein NTY53_15085 [Kiritimatiellaeota bacterium]|nr:hypothetical protein [Kiritimatiellota bacterium]